MKHDLEITIALLVIFLVAQFIGLGILYNDIQEITVTETGEVEVVHAETSLGPRPEVHGFETFIWIIAGVLIGTGLILLFVRFGKFNWWKALFFMGVFFTLSIAFGVFMAPLYAYILALVFALWKIYRSNIVVHNFTELFMYAGIAVLFVPLLDITWIIALLLIISVYDFYAVFKSKHMVKIAEFQTEGQVFAGLSIPYKSTVKASKEAAKEAAKLAKNTGKKVKAKAEEITQAVLGGGDIAFPLIFAGVVLEDLIRGLGVAKDLALLKVLVIPIFAAIALMVLLIISKRGHYYPAMPFITAGCLLGYGVVWLI